MQSVLKSFYCFASEFISHIYLPIYIKVFRYKNNGLKKFESLAFFFFLLEQLCGYEIKHNGESSSRDE